LAGWKPFTRETRERRKFQYEPRSRSLTGPIFNLRSVLTGNTFTSLVVEQVNRTKELFRNQANQKEPTGNVVHIENYAFRGQKVKGQGHQSKLMLTAELRHNCRIGKPANFKLGTQLEHEDSYHRQAPWPTRSKVKVARSHGASKTCWPISRDSRTKVSELPKLVGRLLTPRALMRTNFKVNKSRLRSPGRLYNAESGIASHLQN